MLHTEDLTVPKSRKRRHECMMQRVRGNEIAQFTPPSLPPLGACRANFCRMHRKGKMAVASHGSTRDVAHEAAAQDSASPGDHNAWQSEDTRAVIELVRPILEASNGPAYERAQDDCRAAGSVECVEEEELAAWIVHPSALDDWRRCVRRYECKRCRVGVGTAAWESLEDTDHILRNNDITPREKAARLLDLMDAAVTRGFLCRACRVEDCGTGTESTRTMLRRGHRTM